MNLSLHCMKKNWYIRIGTSLNTSKERKKKKKKQRQSFTEHMCMTR